MRIEERPQRQSLDHHCAWTERTRPSSARRDPVSTRGSKCSEQCTPHLRRCVWRSTLSGGWGGGMRGKDPRGSCTSMLKEVVRVAKGEGHEVE
jgi:hypothetical protein